MPASDNIRAHLAQLQADKDSIDAQIRQAKRVARGTGRYASNDWLRRAEDASSIKGRTMAKLQVELAAALKAERREQSNTFDASFVKHARAMLSPEVFSKIVEAARCPA